MNNYLLSAERETRRLSLLREVPSKNKHRKQKDVPHKPDKTIMELGARRKTNLQNKAGNEVDGKTLRLV